MSYLKQHTAVDEVVEENGASTLRVVLANEKVDELVRQTATYDSSKIKSQFN